jgi:hypothetical protein
MSSTTPALLAAAAGVGFGHAVLPDHWVPLSVIARTQRYPLRRVLRLSTLAGLAHVGFSLALGAVVIGVGLQFRTAVQSREDAIVGGLLIATGALFAVLELLGRGHRHDRSHVHSHSHSHSHGDSHGHSHSHADGPVVTKSRPAGTRLLAFAVPFGAAASPDLTILPVFLAASAVSVAASVGTLLVFSLVTLCGIVGLTVLGAALGYQLRGAWVDRSATMITAGVLTLLGALVVSGVI